MTMNISRFGTATRSIMATPRKLAPRSAIRKVPHEGKGGSRAKGKDGAKTRKVTAAKDSPWIPLWISSGAQDVQVADQEVDLEKGEMTQAGFDFFDARDRLEHIPE
ncbi:uncharacterized protein BP5553_01348 [Venustampulla echinocandica]|uniref:Uncharacterized protein n=1 Tax=Venustampulla echinocandica TaxID=2656787 RepID=A0A370U0R3_9HELO|nr:uncharacterized protein BP5553_01348 [Venustampulla echinocandica]RDL41369.1 hypothetical protein BP5553_01348 [Venustampulla echinocandica]